MADELIEETTEHKPKPKHPKQSDKKKVSARGTPRRREENAAEQRRLKELEASIRAQVAAEEKAHKIVEKLVLEDEVSEDFLIHSGNLITPSHYADVVEERMIAKKCGYPLCNNQLSQIPTQKYKISLKTNRVYDITERKCFCSNFCFKASKYFGSQISDSPVWTRIGESLKTFVLLKSEGSSSRAGAGDVLLGRDDEQIHSSEEIVDDCLANSDRDSYKGHQGDSEEEAAENKLNKFKFTDGNQDLKETNSVLTIPESCTYHDRDIPTVGVSSLSLSSPAAHDKHESYSHKRHFTSKKDTSKQTFSRDTIVQSVRVVFQEWCTQSTLEYLGFSVETRAESSFSDEKEIDPDSFMARAARFFQPAINAEEDSDSDSESGTSSKISEEDIVIKERESLDKNPVCILPPIDSKSKRTIRRRIVLDKLFRTLPDLLSEVKLTVGEISRDLTELVHTFSFCNTNITLKPLQWKIVALVLLVILQRKNSLLSQAMESCCNEFDALLGRLAITREDIDKVLSPLTSYAPQNSAHSEIPKAVSTSKSSEKKDKVVVKEREDYGDMEELD